MKARPNPNDLLEPRTVAVPDSGDSVSNGIGEAVENFAAEHWGLTLDRSEHYDAMSEHGVPVQVKGARWRICNGWQNGYQIYANGRFRIFEQDHEWLKENDGMYAFVVYEQHDVGIVPVYSRAMWPQDLDDWVLDDDPWFDNPNGIDRKAEGSDYRLSWPKVFPEARGAL